MTSRPVEAVPRNVVVAGWGDAGRLFRLSLASIVRLFLVSRGTRWVIVTLLGVLFLEAVAFLVMLPELAFMIPWWFGAMAAAMVVAVLVHVTWRLADPRRVVLLSTDRSAVLDVLFWRRRLSLANPTKLADSNTAAPLREDTANWLRSLPNRSLRFLAQNERVAQLYQDQFPELERTGRRTWYGATELAVPSIASLPLDESRS